MFSKIFLSEFTLDYHTPTKYTVTHQDVLSFGLDIEDEFDCLKKY